MYTKYYIIQWFSILCWNLLGLWLLSWWFLLLLIPLIILRLDCVRVRIRTLRWCGRSPKDRKSMIKACSDEKVTVVGQGWHFFLQGKTPSNKVVFTQNFCKSYIKGKTTYYPCGMTIGALAKEMKKEGKAFWSMPSYENISVGAWIMDWNHGSQGDKGESSDHAFDMVDYLDNYNETHQVEYSNINRDKIKCLLGVSINVDKMNKNIIYEKSAMIVNTKGDMEKWLQPCVQRVLFIGRENIGVVWRETNKKGVSWCQSCCSKQLHRDPHLCSRFCLWFQIDPLNYVDDCGCCNLFNCFREKTDRYGSIVETYHINRLVPYIATVMTVFTCYTYNFEIFVDLDKKENTVGERTKFLHKLVQQLSNIKSGRFEIRYGSRFLFIDVSVKKSKFEEPFIILQELGVKEYALHKGKYQVNVKIEGLEREESLAKFYDEPETKEIRQEDFRIRLRF